MESLNTSETSIWIWRDIGSDTNLNITKEDLKRNPMERNTPRRHPLLWPMTSKTVCKIFYTRSIQTPSCHKYTLPGAQKSRPGQQDTSYIIRWSRKLPEAKNRHPQDTQNTQLTWSFNNDWNSLHYMDLLWWPHCWSASVLKVHIINTIMEATKCHIYVNSRNDTTGAQLQNPKKTDK